MAVRLPLVRVGGRIRQLPAGDTLPVSGGTPAPINAMSVAYSAGRVSAVTEDGVTTSIGYDTQGRVSTVSYPRNGKTRTETYTYNTNGTLAGMTAAEA